MSYFKADMHQILLQMALCPRPHWGSPGKRAVKRVRVCDHDVVNCAVDGAGGDVRVVERDSDHGRAATDRLPAGLQLH